MHIAYIIENRSSSAIEIPLQFLGIDINDPRRRMALGKQDYPDI
jgi:hypothetical protein